MEHSEIDKNSDFNLLQQPLSSQCGENIKINFYDYKTKLNSCKHNHNENILLLDEYLQNQYNNKQKFKCDFCGKNNYNFNNTFYCCSCKKILCDACKINHDNSHDIIDYNKKNFLCIEHKEKFNSYCQKCKLNICSLCENSHKQHEIIKFDNILPNVDEFKANLSILKNNINKFNFEINNIINKLSKIIANIEIFYNINENLINNYNPNNLNYEMIYNIKELNFDTITKDINSIIDEKDINIKFKYLMNMNDRMQRILLF